jgi:hypothetical protein
MTCIARIYSSSKLSISADGEDGRLRLSRGARPVGFFVSDCDTPLATGSLDGVLPLPPNAEASGEDANPLPADRTY